MGLAVKGSYNDKREFDSFEPISGNFCNHTGKKVFKTFAQAEHRVQKIGLESNYWLRPYKCEYCKKWHLTKSK